MSADASPHPSRAEVEILCILLAVGPAGCGLGELPGRLGLSPTLVHQVTYAADTLVRRGLLILAADQYVWTPAAHAHVTTRLAELGVAPST